MKRLFVPLMIMAMIPATISCSGSRLSRYTLNEADAAAAIRQMLQLGTQQGFAGSFSKEMILSTLFPESIKKTLTTLQQLGLTNEIDRFTTTLSTAAEKTASQSIPIFTSSISSMKFTDAMRIVRAGGTSATDYLRANTGTELRRSITPIMTNALNEYKLVEEWNRLIKPVQALAGNRLNLDLPGLMAGMVSEAMFRKIAEKEQEVRNQAAARNTDLLRKVFAAANR